MKSWTSQLNKALPIALIACGGYLCYAFCYNYCWQTVPYRSKGIGMLVGFCIIASLIIVSWILLIYIGPGHVPVITLENDSRDIWQCDPDGFKRWCSTCEQVKSDRAHHTSKLNRCIPRMDHYCAWVAAVIGRDNFKHFIQFVIYDIMACLYIIGCMLAYGHDRDTITPQMAVTYGISAFWAILLSAFLGAHLFYIYFDISTIEWLDLRRGETEIYNISLENGQRLITRLHKNDYKKFGSAYSEGVYGNFQKAMGPNVIYWLLPLPVFKYLEQRSEHFNPKLLKELRRRYDTGEEGYLQLERMTEINNTNTNDVQLKETTKSNDGSVTDHTE